MPTTPLPDVFPATRKAMQANKGKDTKPEMIVRRLVHGMGHRYRLHRKDLPGKPDLVFGPRRKVIFVHGCFWHQHSDPSCRIARMPKSRLDFWRPKLDANRVRDDRDIKVLENMGWRVLTLWECGLRDRERTCTLVQSFLLDDDGGPCCGRSNSSRVPGALE